MTLDRAIAFSPLSFLEREVDDVDEMTDREICRLAWQKYQGMVKEGEGLGKLLEIRGLLKEVRSEFNALLSDRKDALEEVEAKLPKPEKSQKEDLEINSAVQEKKVISGELEKCREVLRVVGLNQAMLGGFLRSYSVRLEIPSIPPDIQEREEDEPSETQREHMQDLAKIIESEDEIESYTDLKEKHSEWVEERKVQTVSGESAVQSAKKGLEELGNVIPSYEYEVFRDKLISWYESGDRIGSSRR